MRASNTAGERAGVLWEVSLIASTADVLWCCVAVSSYNKLHLEECAVQYDVNVNEDLTCAFRASCYSTRLLSWAHTPVINWVVCLTWLIVSSNPIRG